MGIYRLDEAFDQHLVIILHLTIVHKFALFITNS